MPLFWLERNSTISLPPVSRARAADKGCADAIPVLHIVAFSNSATNSLIMLSCWLAWIGDMLLHDTQHAYTIHTHLTPSKSGGQGMYHDPAWMAGVFAVPRTMLELLEMRHGRGHGANTTSTRTVGPCDAAIFTDLDVLPLRPYSALLHLLPTVDFRVFFEPLNSWHPVHGAVNSGFYLVRNTPASRTLLRQWVAYLHEYADNKKLLGAGNQLLLNRALFSPAVRDAHLTWGDFRRGEIYLVARAGPNRKGGAVITFLSNETVAYHGCCLAEPKLDLLAKAARRFGSSAPRVCVTNQSRH